MKKRIAKVLALVLILSSAIVYSPATLQIDVVSAATGDTPAATTPAPAAKTPASTVNGSGQIYVVASGDMMWKIAEKHNLTLEQLLALNPQITNPHSIYAGQKINVGKATATAAGSGTSASFDASKFPSWVETDGLWRTVNKTSFKDGLQYAPTDKDLKTIMRLTSLTPTSVGMTDYLLVVLRDVKQQVDVVGEGSANSGTVTVLVFGDRLIPTEESLGKHTQQLDRGYYNVGIASGYMNLAAISQGFGTHFYMTSQYAQAGARPQTIEEAYLKDKGYKYTIGYDTYKRGDEKAQVDAYGNLKFVAAIVIGTLDEQAETKVTDHNYPENWVISK